MTRGSVFAAFSTPAASSQEWKPIPHECRAIVLALNQLTSGIYEFRKLIPAAPSGCRELPRPPQYQRMKKPCQDGLLACYENRTRQTQSAIAQLKSGDLDSNSNNLCSASVTASVPCTERALIMRLRQCICPVRRSWSVVAKGSSMGVCSGHPRRKPLTGCVSSIAIGDWTSGGLPKDPRHTYKAKAAWRFLSSSWRWFGI